MKIRRWWALGKPELWDLHAFGSSGLSKWDYHLAGCFKLFGLSIEGWSNSLEPSTGLPMFMVRLKPCEAIFTSPSFSRFSLDQYFKLFQQHSPESKSLRDSESWFRILEPPPPSDFPTREYLTYVFALMASKIKREKLFAKLAEKGFFHFLRNWNVGWLMKEFN